MTDEKNRWLYMLTHVADISEDEVRQMDPVHQRFYEECRISNLNEMEKKEYVTSVLEYDDVRESMMCEREVGREEGREEGLLQGEVNTKRQLALKMLAKDFAPDLVAEITGLTEEEVCALVSHTD